MEMMKKFFIYFKRFSLRQEITESRSSSTMRREDIIKKKHLKIESEILSVFT